MQQHPKPALLILNQMAGPMTWELAEDLGKAFGCVALLTGHPDTLQKRHSNVLLYAAVAYERGGSVKRVVTWLQYCWQACWWILRWPGQTPLLLFSNPPMLVWLGWLLALLRGHPYAVMVHDIYPDVLVRTQVFAEQHPLMRLWRWLNRRAYERATVVMTLGEYMAATLSRQFDPAKTAAQKIEVIPPWVDTDVIKPIPKEENWFAQKYHQVGKLTVMYSGNMGIGHDIETMIETARRLRQRDDIHFMFIGAGPKWHLVDEVAKKEKLTNITVLGWQPEGVVPFSLATADVALVSLESSFTGIMVPSKSSYSMAAGSGLLLIAAEPNELRTWIETMNLGSVLKPKDTDSIICQLIAWLEARNDLNRIRNNVLLAANQHFSRNSCALLLVNCLRTQFKVSNEGKFHPAREVRGSV